MLPQIQACVSFDVTVLTSSHDCLHCAGLVSNIHTTFKCMCCEEHHLVTVCCCGYTASQTHGTLHLGAVIYQCNRERKLKAGQHYCDYSVELPRTTRSSNLHTGRPAYSFEGEFNVDRLRFRHTATKCCGVTDPAMSSMFTVHSGGIAKAGVLVELVERLVCRFPVLFRTMRHFMHMTSMENQNDVRTGMIGLVG